VIMARVLAEPRPASLDDSHEPEPWELDEPWTSN